MSYEEYVPKTKGELHDFLAMMMLNAPTFRSDYFRGRSVETIFVALSASLDLLRKEMGEQAYLTMAELAQQMREKFEADPEDKTGDTNAGCRMIQQMEDILYPQSRRVD